MSKNFWPALTVSLALALGSVVSPSTANDDVYLPEIETVAEQNLWAVKEIGVDKVAELGLYGAGVKVAVLDSGISLSTPGINNKVIAYKDFLPSQPQLPDHGTQSAGMIISDFDAATGIRGVAPNASLIVGRVCQMSSCDSYAIRQGLAWAIEQGAQVISMSFGGGADPFMNAAITAAVNQGVVVVASAGNNGCEAMASWGMNRFCKQGVISEQFSASFTVPGLISAGAIDKTKARAYFSSWGPNLDLMAPGVNNATYDPAGATNGFGGTSASAPLIAGIAALILSINPKLTPEQVQAILQSTTKPALSVKPKVWDNCTKLEITNTWTCDNQVENEFPQEYFTGAGIVNALAAVKMTQQLKAGELLPKPTAVATETQIKLTWPGGPAALYSNNKLVAPNAASGYTITGNYQQSYSFHLKRGGVLSEPELLVLQRPVVPPAPVVTEANARADVLNIRTEDLTSFEDQLSMFPGEIGAIFEFDSGKKIPCTGYSPASSDAIDRPVSFSCPLTNASGSLSGKFSLVNKYSRVGPATEVKVASVSPANKVLEITTTYISSDAIRFNWEAVPGAQSYGYRYLPTGEMFCTDGTQFGLRGRTSQPSAFGVEARASIDCKGPILARSELLPYVLLSPKPSKPTGITVKHNEFVYVEFDVPNAKPQDQWRIYRSDGMVVRISPGQRIAMGMQPNENINGKTFSYRIMQVVSDTWGEVWSEPSDPIVVSTKELSAPTVSSCHTTTKREVVCSINPNTQVESTLIEYLDFDGVVVRSTRISNDSQKIDHLQANPMSAAFVRVSALTGRTNEWMRRGNSLTVRIQPRTTSLVTHSAH
jgi:subtilisin family serine protease